MDRFQVTPRLTEFWIDAGKSAMVTNIGSSTVYGSPDSPPTSSATAAWSLAPAASRVEDVGAVWVLTDPGTSSTLTVEPIASGLATDTGTGQPSAIGSGGSGVDLGADVDVTAKVVAANTASDEVVPEDTSKACMVTVIFGNGGGVSRKVVVASYNGSISGETWIAAGETAAFSTLFRAGETYFTFTGAGVTINQATEQSLG